MKNLIIRLWRLHYKHRWNYIYAGIIMWGLWRRFISGFAKRRARRRREFDDGDKNRGFGRRWKTSRKRSKNIYRFSTQCCFVKNQIIRFGSARLSSSKDCVLFREIASDVDLFAVASFFRRNRVSSKNRKNCGKKFFVAAKKKFVEKTEKIENFLARVLT